MNIVDVCEVLYQIRLALEDVALAKRVPYAKMYLESAEGVLVAYLRREGLEPGRTVAEIDALKLKVIKECR